MARTSTTAPKTKQAQEEKEVKEVKPTQPVKEKKSAPRRIPLDLEVPVASNVNGQLTYVSTRVGGLNTEWHEFGSIQYLDIRELLLMRNSQKRFFTDNWISIKDSDDGEFTAEDIYKFLRVDESYGNYYDADNIDTFFELPPTAMKEMATKLSNGMKELLTSIALDKFESGEIDSIKKKQAVIDALGINIDGED